ncbi:MAG: hypothetical protein AAGE76_04180 [Pseudomonadota bacterium]
MHNAELFLGLRRWLGCWICGYLARRAWPRSLSAADHRRAGGRLMAGGACMPEVG